MSKKFVFNFVSNLIEQFECFSIESNFLKLVLILSYNVSPNAYLYRFLIKSNPSDIFISFNYYLNPVAILESFESQTIFFFFMVILSMVNITILLCYIFAILTKKKKNKMDIYFKIFNYLSDIYVWIIFAPSIEIFLKTLENSEFENNLSIFYYIISLVGIILSFIIGASILYLSQDAFFLSDSKIRMNLCTSLIFSFFFRIIGIISIVATPDVEWVQFACNYFIYISSIYFYLSQLPFKDKKISIFYLWVILYSLSNIFVLKLFRLEIMISISDLWLINLVAVFLTFILSYSVYNKLYLCNFMNEYNDQKTAIRFFEDLVCLSESAFEENKSNLLIWGFFKFNFEKVENEKLKIMKINSKESNSHILKRKLITEYIYSKFLELIKNKENNQNILPSEVTYLKYFTFLLRFGFNPIRNFYEMQKISSKTEDFSFYFKANRNLIAKEMKKKIKFHLNIDQLKSNSHSPNMQKYEEFFKIIPIKEKLEADFESLIVQKFDYLEKYMEGELNLHTIFSSNIRFSPKLLKFKNKLKSINQNSSYLQIIKLRLQSLLYCLILNNYSKSSQLEKRFKELHRAKNINYSQFERNLDCFSSDTVICEADFIKNNGEILKTCNSSKLLRFFRFEHHEHDKLKHINDLLPQFFRDYHGKRLKCYVDQSEGAKKSEIFGYAIDKYGFAFPIFTSISLNYHIAENFILIAGISKAHDHSKKFCLCDMEGNMLNISQELFEDFQKEFKELKLEDLDKMNIFNQMPSFDLNEYNLESLGIIKDIKTSLIFPDDSSDFSYYQRKRKKSKTLTSKNSIKNEATTINKIVEITFDVILEQFKCKNEFLKYLVIKIHFLNQIKPKAQDIDQPFIKEIKFSSFKNKSNLITANEKTMIQPDKAVKNEISLIPPIDQKLSNKQSISSNEIKTRVTMLSFIKSVKKLNPKSLKRIILTLSIQILFLVACTSLIGESTRSYHDNIFEPSQEAFLTYCDFFDLNGILLSINIHLEYHDLNLVPLSQKNFDYLAEIYKKSLLASQSIANNYRNSPTSDSSLIQNRLQSTNITYYDVLSKSYKVDGNLDFIDLLLENSREISDLALNQGIKLNYETIIFISRNYPKFLSITIPIFFSIKEEFSNLNYNFNQNIFNILIVFIALLVGFKILEIYFWFGFLKCLENLIKIFFRTSESEINEALDNLKHFSSIMAQNSDKYFQFTLEEYLNRNKQEDNIPNYKPKKPGKRKNMISIKKLSQTPLLIYFGVCSLVLGFFFGLNYNESFSVSELNRNILDLDLAYSKTYVCTSSLVYFEELLLREKIIDNKKFEIEGDVFNSREGRLYLLNSYIELVMNQFADSFSAESLEKENSEDNRLIMNGNLCELLLNNGIVVNKNIACEKLLNGAFLKGLGNVLVELVKTVKSRTASMHNLTTNILAYKQQVQNIIQYINSPDYFEMFLSNIYFHELLQILYKGKKKYYFELLDKEKKKLIGSLFISAIFAVLINLIIIQMIATKIRSIYKSNTIVLSMISYERILNDAQILPIIRKIIKENS